jgi:hypothetical protein
MVDDDSDYELMPKKEVDKLKKELSNLKKNPYGESDRGMDLQKSIERLNNTMNKLISILEDAQQDIIDEYQDSKPLEKLNQILDQNETIAKALVSMHEKIKDSEDAPQRTPPANISPIIQDTGPIIVQTPQIPRPQMDALRQQLPPMPQFNPQQFTQQKPAPQQQFSSPLQQQFSPQPFTQQFSQQYVPQQQQFAQPRPQQMTQPPQQFQRPQINQGPDFTPLPPLDSMNDLPPLEGLDTRQMDSGMLPEQKKKKFLGII